MERLDPLRARDPTLTSRELKDNVTTAEPTGGASPAPDLNAVRYPMVRATGRDVVPIAWRLAIEFTRPTRKWSPFLPGTLVLLPIFVGVAAMPGVYHWERTAVLGLSRSEDGKLRRSGVVAYLVVLTIVELGLLLAAFGPWGIVVWTGSLVVAIGVPRAVGAVTRAFMRVPTRDRSDDEAARSVRAGATRQRKSISFVHSPPPSDWTLSVAAFRPTEGVSALPDIFVPHIRSTVSPGQTVGLVAADAYLADLYRTQFGFVQVGASPLQLQATL